MREISGVLKSPVFWIGLVGLFAIVRMPIQNIPSIFEAVIAAIDNWLDYFLAITVVVLGIVVSIQSKQLKASKREIRRIGNEKTELQSLLISKISSSKQLSKVPNDTFNNKTKSGQNE
jgi:hypothetical protein